MFPRNLSVIQRDIFMFPRNLSVIQRDIFMNTRNVFCVEFQLDISRENDYIYACILPFWFQPNKSFFLRVVSI